MSIKAWMFLIIGTLLTALNASSVRLLAPQSVLWVVFACVLTVLAAICMYTLRKQIEKYKTGLEYEAAREWFLASILLVPVFSILLFFKGLAQTQQSAAVVIYDDEIYIYKTWDDQIVDRIRAAFLGRMEYISTGWNGAEVETVAETSDGKFVVIRVAVTTRLRAENDILRKTSVAAVREHCSGDEIVKRDVRTICIASLKAAIAKHTLQELGENRLFQEWELGKPMQGAILNSGDFEFGNTISVVKLEAWFGPPPAG